MRRGRGRWKDKVGRTRREELGTWMTKPSGNYQTQWMTYLPITWVPLSSQIWHQYRYITS